MILKAQINPCAVFAYVSHTHNTHVKYAHVLHACTSMCITCMEVHTHISTNKENERTEFQISFKKANFCF